jgi:hypothetical protein
MTDKRLPVTVFSFFLGAGLYRHKYKLECIESQTGVCLLPLFMIADPIVAPLNMFNLFPIWLRAEEAV